MLIREFSFDVSSSKIVEEHVAKHFSHSTGAEEWIKKGLEYQKDNMCPFCSQDVNNMGVLLNAYNDYFSETYRSYLQNVNVDLGTESVQLQSIYDSINQLNNLNFTYEQLLSYKGFINQAGYSEELDKIEKLMQDINEEQVKDALQILDINKYLQSKKQNPLTAMSEIDFSKFIGLYHEYIDKLQVVQKLINIQIAIVQSFKESATDTTIINTEIQQIDERLKFLHYFINRIQQNSQCDEYKTLHTNMHTLIGEISALEQQLETEQSTYLTAYFQKINELFQRFGSTDFELTKEENRQGHLPVYELKVNYHGLPVSDNDLNTVFSDSDRRALALSIFLAKLDLLEPTEKETRIVIFDDPVTSFDENRITNVMNHIKLLLTEVGQIIILTHYPHLIKRFEQLTKGTTISKKYLEIEKSGVAGSILRSLTINDFISSEFQKIFEDINNFINGRNHDYQSIKFKLRIFLEDSYLPIIFAKRIADQGIDLTTITLGEKINLICNGNQRLIEKLHIYREALNPDHHLTTLTNEEDVRGFATEMMTYLFNLEIPN